MLADWVDKALGPGGTTTETAARVPSTILNACRKYPEKLVSHMPNRIVGTVIYWTAEVDHEGKTIRIVEIDPAPRPGL